MAHSCRVDAAHIGYARRIVLLDITVRILDHELAIAVVVAERRTLALVFFEYERLVSDSRSSISFSVSIVVPPVLFSQNGSQNTRNFRKMPSPRQPMEFSIPELR